MHIDKVEDKSNHVIGEVVTEVTKDVVGGNEGYKAINWW